MHGTQPTNWFLSQIFLFPFKMMNNLKFAGFAKMQNLFAQWKYNSVACNAIYSSKTFKLHDSVYRFVPYIRLSVKREDNTTIYIIHSTEIRNVCKWWFMDNLALIEIFSIIIIQLHMNYNTKNILTLISVIEFNELKINCYELS